MTIKERIKAELVIRKVALRAGKRPEDVKRDMQEVIDLAWADAAPAARSAQQRRFPTGKPSVEEFMTILSKEL